MIRGTERPIIKVEKTIHANIHNRFDIEVVDATTGRVKQRAVGHNTICNQLWSYLFNTSGGYFRYIHYGTGSGTPASTDTSLFSFLGYVSVDGTKDAYSYGESNGVAYLRKKAVLSETTAVGKTITEVGIAFNTGSSTLCTHAMLKDMNGNPISIEKTATDIINIYATVYLHYNNRGYDNGHIFFTPWGAMNADGMQGFVFTLLGEFYYSGNECGRPSQYQLLHGTNFGGAYDKTAIGGGLVTPSFSVANRTLTLTLARLGASYGNNGGTPIVMLGDYKYLSDTKSQIASPSLILVVGGDWFPYSAIENEAVGTGDGSTTAFSLDFPHAYDAEVYVDGVKCDAVEVLALPNKTLFEQFIWISQYSTQDRIIPYPRDPSASEYTYGPYKNQTPWYFYNPGYTVGIGGFRMNNGKLESSNDMISWTTIAEVGTSYTDITVPDDHQKDRFWRLSGNNTSSAVLMRNLVYPTGYSLKAIRFSEPPASGAVITASYKTPVIAKDANHVFDLTVTIQLGEYNEG